MKNLIKIETAFDTLFFVLLTYVVCVGPLFGYYGGDTALQVTHAIMWVLLFTLLGIKYSVDFVLRYTTDRYGKSVETYLRVALFLALSANVVLTYFWSRGV